MNATIEHASAAIAQAPLIEIERRGPILQITLNRADKFNVLSAAMIEALRRALLEAGADREVRVVVLGASGRAFSAGHDLTEMGPDADVGQLQALFNDCTQLMLTVRRLPQPVIARVQGIATAAGCQLVAMCDLAVADRNARFAVSGINLGLFCSTPAVALSRALLPKPALEMLLTGDFIDADTARERGLINRVVAPEDLDAEVQKLALAIASKSQAAVAMGKRLFYEQLDRALPEAYAQAAEVMANNAVTEDARSAIARFTKRS